jgi:DNA mismatch repair protein MutL
VGIAADELELAFERHATSKLTTLEDLDRLGTLGFRGEALPSIASVSRLRIASRVASADRASWIALEGGEVKERGEGRARTTVEVADPFYTPARRKFLSQAGEFASRCACSRPMRSHGPRSPLRSG